MPKNVEEDLVKMSLEVFHEIRKGTELKEIEKTRHSIVQPKDREKETLIRIGEAEKC